MLSARTCSDDVISMPDKWEYPWYAAWDLAFHAATFVQIDPDFAKDQLKLLLRHEYLHPNGQLPAYEWAFDDVNPPVHAWAAYFIYTIERARTGHGDLQFLRYIFEKLLLNFMWWVNRKDPSGSNVFQGGFLGLDNIGIFDRSHELPTGGFIEQADGTAWMAFYCQIMLAISLELGPTEPLYEEWAAKFLDQANITALMAPGLIHHRRVERHSREPGTFAARFGIAQVIGANEPFGHGISLAAIIESLVGREIFEELA